MARSISPVGVRVRAVDGAHAADQALSCHGLTDFYREEFLKHRECLAKQREYYSERAITDADGAISRVLSELDHLCVRDDADAVMRNLLHKFDVVTGLSAWTDPKNYH